MKVERSLPTKGRGGRGSATERVGQTLPQNQKSGRYASYWNAFLLLLLPVNSEQSTQGWIQDSPLRMPTLKDTIIRLEIHEI